MGLELDKSGACCNTVVTALTELVDGSPTLKIENPGTMAALLSPDNLRGVRLADVQEDGRTIAKIVKYWENPRSTDEETDGIPDFCTPGSTTGQKFGQFLPNIKKHVKLTLSEKEFRDFCGIASDGNAQNVSGTAFAQEQIQAKINELIRAYTRGLTIELATRVGNFTDGDTVKNIPLITPAGGANHVGEVQFIREFEKAELRSDNVIAIGDGLVSDYFKLRQYACCSDAGVNASLIREPFRLFRQPGTDSLIEGNENIIAWSPGSVVPFFRPNFVGPFAHAPGESEIVKINIPVPFNFNGIAYTVPVDFTVKYIPCPDEGEIDSKWVLTWMLHGGLASLPSDMEPSGSPFEGVTNIFHFRGICGAAEYCDPD